MLATFKIGCIDMAYPEHGASYEHNPKFIDRMKHAEGGACSTPYRADGGPTEQPKPPLEPLPVEKQPMSPNDLASKLGLPMTHPMRRVK